MNLIEQMNVLKGLDDAMLQREVKAPSGGAPPYLVLSEINRRKDMRQRYEGELARRKPQTTVAEDTMASLGPAMTESGPMAAAPAIDPAAMGSGAGIAAAVPGGGGPGFADGGIVDLASIRQRYQDKLDGLDEDRDRARALALIAASAGMLGGGHSNTLQNVGLGIDAGVQSYGDALNTIDSREAGFLKDLTDLDLAEQDSNYRERAFALQQAQEGRLSNPPPAYGQTPIFMYDNQDPPQPHMAQPSTGGGFLIEGKLYPGVPTGWSLTNRPVALRVEDTGTNLTTIDTNLGPTAGAAVDVAPIDNAGKKFDEAVGTGLGAQIAEARTAASDAQASMAANDRAIQLLDDGVITGFGADFRVGMGKALQQVGVHLADDEIANTEAFVASRAVEVGRLIKMFGAGTGLSDADREFATKAAAGNIEMNEASIRRILKINNIVAQEAYDKAQTLLAPIAGRSSIPSEVLAVPTPKPGVASGQVGNVTFTVEP
jgi:hypothetical protein